MVEACAFCEVKDSSFCTAIEDVLRGRRAADFARNSGRGARSRCGIAMQ